MTVGQRVKSLLERKNFSKKYIEEKTNIKDETVRNYQNDVSKPKFVFVAWLFEEFPELNPEWLFFGIGEMFLMKSSESKEIEVLKGRLAAIELKNERLEQQMSELHFILKNPTK